MRLGKDTISASAQVPAELWRFPDRTTAIGKMINSYLTSQSEIDDAAVHLLFSANRWEKKCVWHGGWPSRGCGGQLISLALLCLLSWGAGSLHQARAVTRILLNLHAPLSTIPWQPGTSACQHPLRVWLTICQPMLALPAGRAFSESCPRG